MKKWILGHESGTYFEFDTEEEAEREREKLYDDYLLPDINDEEEKMNYSEFCKYWVIGDEEMPRQEFLQLLEDSITGGDDGSAKCDYYYECKTKEEKIAQIKAYADGFYDTIITDAEAEEIYEYIEA